MPSKYGERVDKFYRSTKWKKCRLAMIAEARGICQLCKKNVGTEVHHIIPVTDKNVDDPTIALGKDNLMVLCKSCHDAIRSKDETGKIVEFDADGNVTITDTREVAPLGVSQKK